MLENWLHYWIPNPKIGMHGNFDLLIWVQDEEWGFLLSIFWQIRGKMMGSGTPCCEATHHFQNFYHHFLTIPGHVLTYSSVKTFGPCWIYEISGQLLDKYVSSNLCKLCNILMILVSDTKWKHIDHFKTVTRLNNSTFWILVNLQEVFWNFAICGWDLVFPFFIFNLFQTKWDSGMVKTIFSMWIFHREMKKFPPKSLF